jgi:prephenate dehydrogenase
MKTVVVVGLGFMGGSLAAALKASGNTPKVLGIEPNQTSAQFAVTHGLVDEVVSEVPDDADLIALCVPSDKVVAWVLELESHAATIVDIGSVKGHIVRKISGRVGDLPQNFVPCHPIAGSEKSGPEAADPKLFEDCTVVMTPTGATSSAAVDAANTLWHELGAKTVALTADVHDQMLAATSHLPHLLAFAFMQQIQDGHLDFAGGGFRDFTRIAAANSELWWRIFQLNREELLAAVEQFSADLTGLVTAISDGDEDIGIKKIRTAVATRKAFD